MMTYDIVFLCLARDCAATLPTFLQMLRSLNQSGLRCTAFAGENGSRDATNAILCEADLRGELTLVPTPFMTTSTGRLHRMALGRQHLKDRFAESGMEATFVCVADVDNIMEQPPTVCAVKAALTKLQRGDLFAVSASSRPWYYDLLAYQDDTVCFEDLLDRIAAHRRNIFSYYNFFLKEIYPNQRRLTSSAELFCTSAFNGLSIYRQDFYRVGCYLDDSFIRCEHLTFNRLVAGKTGMKMLIDPDLVVRTPGDHVERSFAAFYWRRVRKLLRR